MWMGRDEIAEQKNVWEETYLWVGFHDRHPPCSMGLLRHEPKEVRWVLRWARKPFSVILLGGIGHL